MFHCLLPCDLREAEPTEEVLTARHSWKAAFIFDYFFFTILDIRSFSSRTFNRVEVKIMYVCMYSSNLNNNNSKLD